MRLRASGVGSGMYIRFSNLQEWVKLRLKSTDNYSPPLDGIIKLPGNIRRSQHQNAIIVVSDTLHLHQEFSLDTPGCF